jgi:hypothetical protein
MRLIVMFLTQKFDELNPAGAYVCGLSPTTGRKRDILPVTSDGNHAAAPQSTEAGVMNKQVMSFEEAAQTLVNYACEAGTLEEFPAIAEQMLEDNSPGEIAAIGAYLPEVLRELLPKRTLH